MNNIRRIFIRDIVSLLKNPFALIVAGGVCILPALYAWFNIYSNWDPYSNTSAIQIAIASEDAGYVDSDGKQTNIARSVIDKLKENKAIAWTVLEKPQDAVDGVYAGKYYAAVVFSEDFTKCMMEGFLEDFKRPVVKYYENEKKNAVAAKITDTAVSNLQNNINEQYISMVVSRLFDKESQVASDIEDAKVVDSLTKRIKKVKKLVDDFAVTVKSLEQANAKLSASLEGAGNDLSAIQDNLGKVQGKAQNVPDTQALADELNRRNSKALGNVSKALEAAHKAGAQVGEAAAEKKLYYYQVAYSELGYAKDSIDTLINSLNTINLNTVNSTEKITITQLENVAAMLERSRSRLQKNIEAGGNTGAAGNADSVLQEQLNTLQQSLQGTVTQSLATIGTELRTVSDQVVTVIDSINSDIDLVNIILDNGVTAVDLTNQSFAGMETQLGQVSVKLSQAAGVLEKIDQTELTESFLHFMQGNPEEYGMFFAEPISIETQAIYPVENYGSGVTPFYTTLAIWVGGVILVSLIKVRADTDGLRRPKAYQLFIGRYLLFFVLSMIQTAIIIWGDLCLLKVQCMYPKRFLAAALIAGFTFSLLIYAFTLSFGDIGKAIIVVIMVIQIAGSSGTYPIEILPEFYQKVYIFFPFPYSINAMREAICGMYEHDYTLYLIQLLLFAAAALVLGLVIRRPFMKINHFVEQRMEDTEMM